MIDRVKNAVVTATTSLFSHGPRPLENTLDHLDDPGLLGPGSISWEVIGDATAFVGGIRALLVQTAHPEVVVGVEQHSSYRTDPLGRLTRTSLYVTETTYGAMPEVEKAVAMVRRVHEGVRGRSERDRPYSAGQAPLAAWVHNVLTDSFLAAYRSYGPRRLSEAEADRFVAEQARIGALLGAEPMPETAAALSDWITGHADLAPSDAQSSALAFLQDPPLSRGVRLGYRLLLGAAIDTIPAEMRRRLGLETTPSRSRAGRATVASLRWALGSSPSWHLALVRAGAPAPADVTFRQPLPPEARDRSREIARATRPHAP